MQTHEFGIMQTDPKKGKRYAKYQPKKYNCISVGDADLEPFYAELDKVPCYWFIYDGVPEYGLQTMGVTLIPPESLSAVLEIVSKNPNLAELCALLSRAREDNKYVIHFGV